jgi:hypothetical protein
LPESFPTLQLRQTVPDNGNKRVEEMRFLLGEMQRSRVNDKRIHPRLSVEVPAEVTFFDRRKMHHVESPRKITVRNISAGGLAMSMERKFGRGELNALFSGKLSMFVDVVLPANTLPIRAMAKTVWIGRGKSRGFGSSELDMGASFLDIHDTDRTRIDRYVRSNL